MTNEMILTTKRLALRPLTARQLALSLEDYPRLQLELGLTGAAEELDEDMRYAMTVRHKRVLEAPEIYPWLTNWAIICRERQTIIGYIMLKGYPNEAGEVVVGYAIDEPYRRRGYASETLQALKEWVFRNPRAQSLIADVEKENDASHSLLAGLGAVRYKKDEELVWWRLSR